MVALSQAQERGLEALLSDLVDCLEARGLEAPVLEAYERLVDKPKFWVGRLRFEEGAGPATLIVKHVPPQGYPPEAGEISADLQEEQLVYGFLERLRPGFERFPRLMGQRPGLMILEDLKEEADPVSPAEVQWRGVAETLARLHCAAAGQQELYHRRRQAQGLDPRPGVGCPERWEWFGFLEGLKSWHGWAELLERPLEGRRALVASVRSQLLAPGPFLTLVHTELASTRNLVRTPRGVCLIDFERARLGHALLDVATAIMGSIEWHTQKEGYFLRHLDAGEAFAEAHHAAWRELGGPAVDEELWRDALTAALVFCAGLATGAAERAEARHPAAQPLPQILQVIFRRLAANLAWLDRLTDLGRTLQDVAEAMEGAHEP